MNAVASRSARARRGFALMLAMAFLALVMLTAVGAAYLVRRETSVAVLSQHQAAARRNARVALDLALGQLQRWAGPDRRVTATSESHGAAQPAITGVWDATGRGRDPLTWLVSGNEGADPLRIGPDASAATWVELVGASTADAPFVARAPRQAVDAVGEGPSTGASRTTGHYAWWIGDQGVKASLVPPPAADLPGSAPYDTEEARRRLWQQSWPGARPAEADPLDPANEDLVRRVETYRQLAHLRRPDGSVIGPAARRLRYGDWTVESLGVLADTAAGGLRRDLSLRPGLLGAAFAAWADYPAYLEDPAGPGLEPRALPPIAGPSSLRRRYRMTAPQRDAGLAHGVAPVLSYFLLGFNVRTDPAASGAIRPVGVRARWMLSLWNPYTSALVPEDLELEVAGLPEILRIADAGAGGAPLAYVPLAEVMGSPFRIRLPWTAAGRPDQHSWLPGRVYTWSSAEHLDPGAAPAEGFPSVFYTRNLSAAAGQGVQRSAAPAAVPHAAQVTLVVDSPTRLRVELRKAAAGAGAEPLAVFEGPEFAAFATSPGSAASATYQFCFFFRLAESIDTLLAPETWLATPGLDPRASPLPAGAFVTGNNGNRPELYPGFSSIAFPDRLLDRSLPATATSGTGQSYNEDVPLFELPRAPVVTLGALQHVQVAGARPLAVGNSWGAAGGWNALFDRYFFSGLVPAFAPGAAGPAPNRWLRLVPRPDGTRAGWSGLAEARLEDGYSSAELLQGGAFNVNSVRSEAWAAVLRGARLPPPLGFTYLDAAPSTGTGGDAPRTLADGGALFFRFPQSAQETFEADTPSATSTYAASTTIPPAAPSSLSNANTHLFRRGVRLLGEAAVSALAEAIVANLRQRQAVEGPIRSLAHLLDPWPGSFVGGKPASLLERAIADAGLNDAVAEFSSQWLTQADLMTQLAPVLFARSDTFVIRVYGDALDPGSGRVEARAYAEATVQRLPAYVDDRDPPETAPADLREINRQLGRRFQVVRFRWLSADAL